MLWRPLGYLSLAVLLTLIGAAYAFVCAVILGLASGAIPTKQGVDAEWWLPFAGAIVFGWMLTLFTPGVIAQALLAWALTARAFSPRFGRERLASFHSWGPKVTLAAPLHSTPHTDRIMRVDRFAWGNDWRLMLASAGIGTAVVIAIALRLAG